MSIARAILLALLLSAGLQAQKPVPPQWLTDYEKSDYLATPRYDATVAFCARLAKASPWVRFTSFGKSPQGRDLPLVILSRDGRITPAQAIRSAKPLILIQSGIHAGEIDGKDASLMLIRDIAVTKSLAGLLDHCNLLFMPIFNVDGHERFGPANRINQNGPREMGWRVTAQNINLNRDYLKADAPEMRAWLAAFNAWKPDMVIDCHVTDGIDFPYTVTYSMEMYDNAPPSVVRWQRELEKFFTRKLNAAGPYIAPYVFPREDRDLSKGLEAGAAPPRFSTGYAAIRNRAALLIETHMLKNYRERVESTSRLIRAVLEFVNADPNALRDAVKTSDRETVRDFSSPAPPAIPLRFTASEKASRISFTGYTSEIRKSELSGGEYIHWTRDTATVTIPMFDDLHPSLSVRPPRCYIIPQEWKNAVAVLEAHGLALDRLSKVIDVPVESYRFKNPRWREQPYEGRHTASFALDTIRGNRTFAKGDYVLKLGQPGAKAAVHLLEPDGPDSFVQWGFFDAVFERKEYYESYIMEELARSMEKNDPGMKAEFDRRVASDTAFAKSPSRRLEFFYERSPFADQQWRLYPVARYMEPIELPVEGKR